MKAFFALVAMSVWKL